MNITMDYIHAKSRREGACVVWTGSIASDGRPVLHMGRHSFLSIRKVVLELRTGEPLAKGLYACCTCETRGCLEHVKALTRSQQMLLAAEHGRIGGEAYSRRQREASRKCATKLDMAKAEEIRRRREAGDTLVALAKEFGVHHSFIARICAGQAWAPILPPVQRIPTPPGRFEPRPGFERAITADWMLRRQGVDIHRQEESSTA